MTDLFHILHSVFLLFLIFFCLPYFLLLQNLFLYIVSIFFEYSPKLVLIFFLLHCLSIHLVTFFPIFLYLHNLFCTNFLFLKYFLMTDLFHILHLSFLEFVISSYLQDFLLLQDFSLHTVLISSLFLY